MKVRFSLPIVYSSARLRQPVAPDLSWSSISPAALANFIFLLLSLMQTSVQRLSSLRNKKRAGRSDGNDSIFIVVVEASQ